jgi:hypothetical protein
MALSQSVASELLEAFRAGEGVDLIRESVRLVMQELIETEATEQIVASRYERAETRVTVRNGSRPRLVATQAGDVELRIPKLRRPPAPPDTRWPIRGASLTAEVAVLLMSIVAIFGNVVVIDGLITEGHAARTAADIMASLGLFRLGIASLVIVVALDVVVAWALYRVFSPVTRSLSMPAAALRLVYSGVLMVAVGQLLGVVRLLGDDTNLDLLGADQLNAQ